MKKTIYLFGIALILLSSMCKKETVPPPVTGVQIRSKVDYKFAILINQPFAGSTLESYIDGNRIAELAWGSTTTNVIKLPVGFYTFVFQRAGSEKAELSYFWVTERGITTIYIN